MTPPQPRKDGDRPTLTIETSNSYGSSRNQGCGIVSFETSNSYLFIVGGQRSIHFVGFLGRGDYVDFVDLTIERLVVSEG